MYFSNNSKNGNIAVIVREATEVRLLTRCFRGTNLRLAGNFSRWSSADEMFRDKLVKTEFLAELEELRVDRDFGTHSLTIEHTEEVGWDSTAPIADYSPGMLEHFELNRKSWGMRVLKERTDIYAPRTNCLTIVYQFKEEGDWAVAVIHSIYPGYDVGELVGDITAREHRVFFDWSHFGE